MQTFVFHPDEINVIEQALLSTYFTAEEFGLEHDLEEIDNILEIIRIFKTNDSGRLE